MPTDRSRVRRLPELASYDDDVIHGILDADCVCHVGVVLDGRPLVLPTLFVRDGQRLLLHGSVSSLLLRTAATTSEVCVSVTLVDGIVVARSSFNSSMAYRSAVVFGTARLLEGDEERRVALDLLIEGVLPHRTSEVRLSSESELRRTAVVEVTIEEASAKINEGPPNDDDDDIAGDAWAGVIPYRRVVGPVENAPDGKVGQGLIEIPTSVRSFLDRHG